MSNILAKDLYESAQLLQMQREVHHAINEMGRKAVDEALLRGLAAYSPGLAAQGVEQARPYLVKEPTHQPGISLVRWKPTGEALMFIGEPQWPVGEYADLSEIKIAVPYELIKAEDRRMGLPL